MAAFIEDIVDVARRRAASSTNSRLDPPLALILDEAANYALPSLPALISEGGGTGITTIAALQSLSQARARWGEQEGAAIWDAASVKVILGGGSNARDLQDLSALIGERDEQTESWSRDADGRRSTSTSIRRVPILDTGQLRTLSFGTGILLSRSIRPVALALTPSINPHIWSALRFQPTDIVNSCCQCATPNGGTRTLLQMMAIDQSKLAEGRAQAVVSTCTAGSEAVPPPDPSKQRRWPRPAADPQVRGRGHQAG